jgi:Holliday junction resolvasome RuvABC endonuclease subunit
MSTTASEHEQFILAVHPTSRGFGWVVFEGAGTPVEWGSVSARGRRSSRLFIKFERILRRWQPDILVLEEFEERSGKTERLRKLSRDMADLASFSGMDVAIYERNNVREAFASESATTRHEIAQAIAKRIDAFSQQLPRNRPCGDTEFHHQGLFDAAALAMTYFAKRGQQP